ncbi:terpene synthase 10-like [Gossypium australe]|uniref:Terpene synthase 10-like n=1 Tax=Gossypium australe TaxID=47621 RepID=A0A5B6X422_9ROSI|nr:terpene synthase 10-like [Gossypium australe]
MFLGHVVFVEGSMLTQRRSMRNYSTHNLKLAAALNLRQRHWIELLKDCNCVIEYHLGKANVVYDVLSQKVMVEL